LNVRDKRVEKSGGAGFGGERGVVAVAGSDPVVGVQGKRVTQIIDQQDPNQPSSFHWENSACQKLHDSPQGT